MAALFHTLPRLAGLGALFLLSALPALAQTPILTLGTSTNSGTGPSGSATISGTGTQASGVFKFSSVAGPTTSAYKFIRLYNTSTLTLSAGSVVTADIFSENATTTTVQGGTVHVLNTISTSTANFFSGTVDLLSAFDQGTGNVYGGAMTYCATQGDGTLDFFGTGLMETFLSYQPPSSDTGPAVTYYALTGSLQDGSALNVTYADVTGSLLFNGVKAIPTVVPEASTTVSLALLLALGLGGMAVAARRKKSVV